MLDEFKKQYIDKCINGNGFDEELSALFTTVLNTHFEDDHLLMDEFIQSIIDENTIKEPTEIEKLRLENEQLKQSVQMNETIILELADMMLSR